MHFSEKQCDPPVGKYGIRTVFLWLSHYSCHWKDHNVSTVTCESSSVDKVDCEKYLLHMMNTYSHSVISVVIDWPKVLRLANLPTCSMTGSFTSISCSLSHCLKTCRWQLKHCRFSNDNKNQETIKETYLTV